MNETESLDRLRQRKCASCQRPMDWQLHGRMRYCCKFCKQRAANERKKLQKEARNATQH